MRKLDLERDADAVRRMHGTNMTIKEQAAALDVSYRAIERARAKLGLSVAPKPMVEITPEIDALLRQAVEDGWSREEAFKTTGVSLRRLARLYPGLNMPPVERGHLGSAMRTRRPQVKKHRDLGGGMQSVFPIQ